MLSKKDKEYQTAQYKCAVCNKCKIYIEGPMRGTCIYGGPFGGYIKIEEPSNNGRPQTLESLGNNVISNSPNSEFNNH